MSAKVTPIPDGFHTLTPHLIVRGAAEAIEFYKNAFGAEEVMRSTMPGSKTIMHASLRIGDSVIMLNDEFPNYGALSPVALNGSPVTIHLYVTDVDAVFNRAVAAGATARMPVADMFWGDRYGKLTDPFGHHWSIATRKEIVSPAELEKRAAKAFGEKK
jgi:uncharacterized glyoxalase superfamily protein PhnB